MTTSRLHGAISLCPKALLLCFVAATLLGCQTLDHQIASDSLRGTTVAREALTNLHGAEVRNSIENFESRWHSLEANQDPSIQSELATGPYLNYWGYARVGAAVNNGSSWTVSRSASVQKVEVSEYSAERFKAVACVVRFSQETTTTGIPKGTTTFYKLRGVYVFARETGLWKLAGFFDITIPGDVARDWEGAPQWMRDLMVSVPAGLDKDCVGARGP